MNVPAVPKGSRLTPLYVVGKISTGTVWRCKCACGGIKDVVAARLTSGRVKSCGCIKSEIARHAAEVRWGRVRNRPVRSIVNSHIAAQSKSKLKSSESDKRIQRANTVKQDFADRSTASIDDWEEAQATDNEISDLVRDLLR